MNRLALVSALIVLITTSCSTIDRSIEPVASTSRAPSTAGFLAREIQASTARFPKGHSGFHLLEGAEEALDWRLAITDHATRSIDIQYYLWHVDETGLLLLERLLDAADRGVRVRLQIDDLLFSEEEERIITALSNYPNFEIRIFNPTNQRSGGVAGTLEVLARFQQLNRRLHNKTFCVDGRIAILGGRNIGNEYFGLSEKFNFVDLDVMTVGPVLGEISDSFDRYWNSKLSIPGEAFPGSGEPENVRDIIAEIRREVDKGRSLLSVGGYPTERRHWAREFAWLRSKWHTGRAVLVADAPTRAEERGRARFLREAFELLETPASGELLFVSPYLLPERKVHGVIDEYLEGGADVRILTASMAANNHLIVHAHYRKHRHPLLDKGVRLYEMREDAGGIVARAGNARSFESKKLALHVKAGVGDRTRCFIGSLNLDPRSINLNTENGLLIESPSLARELASYLDVLMSRDNSWEVSKERGGLVWRSRGEEVRREPAPDEATRRKALLFGLLPIEQIL